MKLANMIAFHRWLFGFPAAAMSLALALSPAASVAAECGASGNTLWGFGVASSPTRAVIGGDVFYITDFNTLSRRNPATGAELNSTSFSGGVLGQPLFFGLKTLIGLPATDHLLVVLRENVVFGLHPVTLATLWSTLIQRAGHAEDVATAAPVVQMWQSSNAGFQAARSSDIVMIGTAYPSSTTANRVYGLIGNTGSVAWIFNPTGSYQVDAIHGLCVDYARNQIYVVSDESGTSAQNSVWAVSTINGAKLWSRDLGAVEAEPVLANGLLYVASRSGALYVLNPDTGSTIWSTPVTSTALITIRLVTDDSRGGDTFLYAVDSDGTLHAYVDRCSGLSWLWDFKPTGSKVSAAPAVFGSFVYAGADDGLLWQVRASDGVGLAHATISGVGAAPSYDPLVIDDNYGSSPRILARSEVSVKKLCIPWPDTAGDRAFLLDPPRYYRWSPSERLGLLIDSGRIPRDWTTSGGTSELGAWTPESAVANGRLSQ